MKKNVDIDHDYINDKLEKLKAEVERCNELLELNKRLREKLRILTITDEGSKPK